MNFFGAKKYILTRLKNELQAHLTYHGYHHTLDVYEMAVEIARSEGITDENDLILLKTAVLFHDSGFLVVYNGHEEAGFEIAKSCLADYDYTPDQIEKVCNMIEATKIPQNPQNLLEKIIADADLDYLGRNDFYQISNSLFEELKTNYIITDENQWNKIQVDFLQKHNYFTKTNIDRRTTEKENRLNEIIKKLL